MTVAGTLHKLAWGGSIAVDDAWSCGLHLLAPEPGQLASAPIIDALKVWMGQALTALNTSASLDWVKLNAIDPVTGRYLDGAHPRTEFVDPAVKGNGAPGAPHLTVALSLRTGNLRGLAHAGRIYPPTGQVSVDVTGHIAGITADGMNSNMNVLLVAITAAGAVPVVFSSKGQLTNPITQIACGRVVDTQQRRRNALKELYQLKAVG